MAGSWGSKVRSWLTGIDRTKPPSGLRTAPMNQPNPNMAQSSVSTAPQPEMLGSGGAQQAGTTVKTRKKKIDAAVDSMTQ